ncbi:hypothetical protein TcCL_NonESM04575 [Trypanosoma cruzi]|nr:hypothetical protein TcCL_NonESM04575 [Trypanosoma cruzi]
MRRDGTCSRGVFFAGDSFSYIPAAINMTGGPKGVGEAQKTIVFSLFLKILVMVDRHHGWGTRCMRLLLTLPCWRKPGVDSPLIMNKHIASNGESKTTGSTRISRRGHRHLCLRGMGGVARRMLSRVANDLLN